MANLNDIQLLSSFVQDRSEAGYRELVARYTDMVYSTALRRLSDPGRAQEVAQDVFVCLAQKAHLLTHHRNLSGWLYKTTLMNASNALRGERRRQRRENDFLKASELEREPRPESPDGLEHLDEALAALRDKDREAVMLRYFQGYSLREVGQALGSGEEAARKRVHRAVAKMADFFGRRGLVGAGAAAVLAEGVLKSSVHAAPAGFAKSTASAALATSTAAGAGSSTAVLILKIATMTKLQTTIVCGALVMLPLIFQQITIGNLRTEHQELQPQVAELPAPLSNPSPANVALADIEQLADGIVKPEDSEEESAEDFLAELLGGVDVAAIEKAQVEVKISELATVLDLSDEQLIKLRALADSRIEKKAAILKSLTSGSGDTNMENAQAFMADPLAGLESILTDEQQELYAAHIEAKDNEAAAQMTEQFAHEELGKIQKLLNLSPEQQDKVVIALTEYWNEPLSGENLGRDVERFLTPEQREIWKVAGDDHPEDLKGRALFEASNAERLKKFEEFLTPEQLEIYRLHLERETAELFDWEDKE